MIQEVEPVASIRARAEKRLDRHQRMMEGKLTIDPDNPESVYDGFDGRNSVLRVFQ
jgi:hypothetical protein